MFANVSGTTATITTTINNGFTVASETGTSHDHDRRPHTPSPQGDSDRSGL